MHPKKRRNGHMVLSFLNRHPYPRERREDRAHGYKKKNRRDEHGNLFVYRGRVWDSQGKQDGKWAWDVFLAKGE